MRKRAGEHEAAERAGKSFSCNESSHR